MQFGNKGYRQDSLSEEAVEMFQSQMSPTRASLVLASFNSLNILPHSSKVISVVRSRFGQTWCGEATEQGLPVACCLMRTELPRLVHCSGLFLKAYARTDGKTKVVLDLRFLA